MKEIIMYTFDENIVSDLHKDARGYRPYSIFWEMWNAGTDNEKQSIWDGLIAESDWATEQDKIQEKHSVEQFNITIAATIKVGANDQSTALRWMTDAEKFVHEQDVENWVWKQGILFTDCGREVLAQLKEIWQL